MAGKLDTVKKVLLTSLLKEITLQEIFNSNPFRTSFDIHPGTEATYETESFKDLQGNLVDIHFLESGKNSFELDFQVNKNSFKAANVTYTLKDYAALLSTVAAAVTQFLREHKPYGITFKGVDDFESVKSKPNKQGQKDRIYNYFITQLGNNPDYIVGRYPDGIGLQRIMRD